MDYDLLQRHGVTNIEYEPIEDVKPWPYAIDGIGDVTLRFELNGAGLDRLEFALRLLEEHDVKAAGEEGPHSAIRSTICLDAWDDDVDCDEGVDEEGDCDDKGCWVMHEQPVDGEWDDARPDEGVDEAPMPAHYKYNLKYR